MYPFLSFVATWVFIYFKLPQLSFLRILQLVSQALNSYVTFPKSWIIFLHFGFFPIYYYHFQNIDGTASWSLGSKGGLCMRMNTFSCLSTMWICYIPIKVRQITPPPGFIYHCNRISQLTKYWGETAVPTSYLQGRFT